MKIKEPLLIMKQVMLSSPSCLIIATRTQGNHYPSWTRFGCNPAAAVDDRHNYNKAYLEDTLVMLLGGRVAEELILDQVTTGASNDIERATKMARSMVCQWGYE